MGTILSQIEAENILQQLPEGDKAEIAMDKIRFGEYFIQSINNKYSRVSPINVIVKNGRPQYIEDVAITLI